MKTLITQTTHGPLALTDQPSLFGGRKGNTQVLPSRLKDYINAFEPEFIGVIEIESDRLTKTIKDARERISFFEDFCYLDEALVVQGEKIRKTAEAMILKRNDEIALIGFRDYQESARNHTALRVECLRVYHNGHDFAADIYLRWQVI